MLFFFTTSSLFFQAHCQEVVFSYDNAGNRTLQKVIYLDESFLKADSLDNVTLKEIIEQPTEFKTILQNAEIKIYPNPTAGQIYVSVNRLQKNAKIEIKTPTGAQIFQGQLDKEITTIDLSHHPKGVYYLELSYGINMEVWKIIKN
jgi:hypothetical protein